MDQTDRYAPIKALLITFLCQFVGATFSTGLGNLGVPLLFLFAIHSFISGYLSFFFRLSTPWRFLNFMIPGGLLVSVAFPGYGWIWLVFLVIFGLIFLPTFWTRVPYYPSSEKIYALIAKELPSDRTFKFLDIGCGDAKLLSYLALKFPLASFEGADLSPSAIAAAKMNTCKNKNVKTRFADYWKINFADYDFIYAFLSPTPMEQVEKKALGEMKKGSKLLVNSFALPNLSPSREIPIDDKNQSSLLIYNINPAPIISGSVRTEQQ